MENIEIINGVPVDWNKYQGKDNKRSKDSYIGLCKLLHKNGHKLESDYIDNSTKVFVNFHCGHTPHSLTPNNYKNGNRCPKCSGHCPEQAKEGFMNMLKENGHELLSEYVNERTEVVVDYGCGHTPHSLTPNNYKRGVRCPACDGQCPKQAKEDLIKLVETNGHKLLSEYKNAKNKVLIQFDCNHKPSWVNPSDYKNGKGCPRCVGKGGQAKDDFINMLEKNGHILESEYIDVKTKVKVNYGCGHSSNWTTPDNYRRGARCPICKNKGEAALYKLLVDTFEEVKTQHKYNDLRDIRQLPYDFYLPKYNLLIELDGRDHREEVIRKSTKKMTDSERDMEEIDAFLRLQDRQYKDRLKDDYAKANNIPLLRIEYNGKIDLDKWKQLILDKIKEIETRIV